MSDVMTLLPGFMTQFVLGFILVATFVQTGDNIPIWKPLVTSLLMLILSPVIVIFLSKFLYQGTLAMQWMLFVVLAHKVCSMPLDKSMLSQFCFFSWMLGIGFFLQPLEGTPPWEIKTDKKSDEEKPALTITDLQASQLSHQMVSVRNAAVAAIYKIDKQEITRPAITLKREEKKKPAPEETEDTQDPVTDVANASEFAVEMTGNEFEALFYDTSTTPMELIPLAAPSDDPLFSDPSLDAYQGEFEELTPPTTLDPSETQNIVEVQNLSTDPAFTPPEFIIGAVSFGKKGSFAMVNGKLLQEGAILRTGTSNPRGWRLHRITETDLFWQPLK